MSSLELPTPSRNRSLTSSREQKSAGLVVETSSFMCDGTIGIFSSSERGVSRIRASSAILGNPKLEVLRAQSLMIGAGSSANGHFETKGLSSSHIPASGNFRFPKTLAMSIVCNQDKYREPRPGRPLTKRGNLRDDL
jgi:hypothetical protein